ncbi:hypothetical protein BGZ99_008926 [Dissophora globulifera]|uniref:Uncharacterized protein n=1 Tax=Dissophora globulifera TaxID=979702 RepID=A0A9P6RQZ4_9FUNG|nr:hypothetical protein BGZ99_008926 [Dissophora globulifera]
MEAEVVSHIANPEELPAEARAGEGESKAAAATTVRDRSPLIMATEADSAVLATPATLATPQQSPSREAYCMISSATIPLTTHSTMTTASDVDNAVLLKVEKVDEDMSTSPVQGDVLREEAILDLALATSPVFPALKVPSKDVSSDVPSILRQLTVTANHASNPLFIATKDSYPGIAGGYGELTSVEISESNTVLRLRDSVKAESDLMDAIKGLAKPDPFRRLPESLTGMTSGLTEPETIVYAVPSVEMELDHSKNGDSVEMAAILTQSIEYATGSEFSDSHQQKEQPEHSEQQQLLPLGSGNSSGPADLLTTRLLESIQPLMSQASTLDDADSGSSAEVQRPSQDYHDGSMSDRLDDNAEDMEEDEACDVLETAGSSDAVDSGDTRFSDVEMGSRQDVEETLDYSSMDDGDGFASELSVGLPNTSFFPAVFAQELVAQSGVDGGSPMHTEGEQTFHATAEAPISDTDINTNMDDADADEAGVVAGHEAVDSSSEASSAVDWSTLETVVAPEPSQESAVSDESMILVRTIDAALSESSTKTQTEATNAHSVIVEASCEDGLETTCSSVVGKTSEDMDKVAPLKGKSLAKEADTDNSVDQPVADVEHMLEGHSERVSRDSQESAEEDTEEHGSTTAEKPSIQPEQGVEQNFTADQKPASSFPRDYADESDEIHDPSEALSDMDVDGPQTVPDVSKTSPLSSPRQPQTDTAMSEEEKSRQHPLEESSSTSSRQRRRSSTSPSAMRHTVPDSYSQTLTETIRSQRPRFHHRPSWHFVPGSDLAFLSEMAASTADLRRFRRETQWLEERVQRPKRDLATDYMLDRALGLTRHVSHPPPPALISQRQDLPNRSSINKPSTSNNIDNTARAAAEKAAATSTAVLLSSDSRLALSMLKMDLLSDLEEQTRLESDRQILLQRLEQMETQVAEKQKRQDEAEREMQEVAERQQGLEMELQRVRTTEQSCLELRERQRRQAQSEIRELEGTLEMLQQRQQYLERQQLPEHGQGQQC